jgi:hypothetical protein
MLDDSITSLDDVRLELYKQAWDRCLARIQVRLYS